MRTLPVALAALVCFSALLSTAALALVAHDLLGICEPGSLALVQLLQRHFVFALYVLPFARLSPTARHSTHATHPRHTSHARWHAVSKAHAAEHLRKNVVDIGSLAHTAASRRVECGHAMRVVEISLVVIVEDLVCLTGCLEAYFGFGAFGLCDLVGMVRKCGLYPWSTFMPVVLHSKQNDVDEPCGRLFLSRPWTRPWRWRAPLVM